MEWVGFKKEIQVSEERLGKGSSSTKVLSGMYKTMEVAVKMVDKEDFSDQRQVSKELECLRLFDHRNVLSYMYDDHDDKFWYIILPKCECTLDKVVEIEHPSIPWVPYKILHHITDGVEYLHNEKNLVHRDLKPSNILFHFADGKWTVKIGDFGISKILKQDQTSCSLSSEKGTRAFMAPELMKDERLGREADIFSLGIVFYYVLSKGKHPFGKTWSQIHSNIYNGGDPKLSQLKEYTYDTKKLISTMLAHLREDRPRIKQVQAHHIFWDSAKKLDFIQESSDYILGLKNKDLEERKNKDLERKLEKGVGNESGKNWGKKLIESYPQDSALTASLRKMGENGRMKTPPGSIKELLRKLRNWKHHYYEATDAFKKEIGVLPDGLVNLFTEHFPNFLSHLYEVMKDCSQEEQFKAFYGIFGELESEGPSFSGSSKDTHDHKAIHATAQNKESEGANASSDLEKIKLNLRSYQKELAQQASRGISSLIIAPTGCGKTMVAASVMKKELERRGSKRILFFVSKVVLAEQQYLFFKRCFSCQVACITGYHPPELDIGEEIKQNNVIVMTAQMLVNVLREEQPPVTFDDISLMVFDECHHAGGKNPYKVLLDMFQDFRIAKPDHAPVQILGLTASPGVGKADSQEEVVLNLLTLLATLNVTTYPTVVVKNQANLKKHQNELKESYVQVWIEDDAFTRKLLDIMREIENAICMFIGDNWHYRKASRNSLAYRAWISGVKLYVQQRVRDANLSTAVITYTEHLKMYFDVLSMKDLVPNIAKHVPYVKLQGELSKDLRWKYEELLALERYIKAPMLDTLTKILKTELVKSDESCCIVFIRRKLAAKCLTQCLIEDDTIKEFGPMYLLGAHQGESSEGMTKSEQRKAVQAFQNGRCRVLVATSAAEEGLDIKACNLVIGYDFVSNEVGRIQRGGRGRAMDSKCILIAAMGSNQIAKEEMNKNYSKATDKAVAQIAHYPSQHLRDEILKIQNSERIRRVTLETSRLRMWKDHQSRWRILCGTCKRHLTDGNKLFHIENKHTVVQDPEFESRATKKACNKPKGPRIVLTAEFFCKNPQCGSKVASAFPDKQRTYTVLSLDKVLFQRGDEDPKVVKKRVDLPFDITQGIDDIKEGGSQVNGAESVEEPSGGAQDEEEEDADSTKEPTLESIALQDCDTAIELLTVLEQ